MVPFQVTLVPVFELLFKLHWLNTYQGLIVPRATSAFGIFLLRQFFITVPRELDEAARADGASEWYIYSRIMLPLAKPALATLAVFYFMSNWNDFLWPLVVTSTTNMRTLPAGLTLFAGQYVVEHGVLMAGAVISLLPLAVAFALAQRYFTRGSPQRGSRDDATVARCGRGSYSPSASRTLRSGHRLRGGGLPLDEYDLTGHTQQWQEDLARVEATGAASAPIWLPLVPRQPGTRSIRLVLDGPGGRPILPGARTSRSSWTSCTTVRPPGCRVRSWTRLPRGHFRLRRRDC